MATLQARIKLSREKIEMKTIVGLYDDIATARRVVEELATAGFERGDISLVANNQMTGTTADRKSVV